MIGNPSLPHLTAPFVLLLSYDPNTNVTSTPDRYLKQSGVGQEYRVHHIGKTLNNAREAATKCKSGQCLHSIIEDVRLDDCTLYPTIHELATSLPVQAPPMYSQ